MQTVTTIGLDMANSVFPNSANRAILGENRARTSRARIVSQVREEVKRRSRR
jgi:hypothetical protein